MTLCTACAVFFGLGVDTPTAPPSSVQVFSDPAQDAPDSFSDSSLQPALFDSFVLAAMSKVRSIVFSFVAEDEALLAAAAAAEQERRAAAEQERRAAEEAAAAAEEERRAAERRVAIFLWLFTHGIMVCFAFVFTAPTIINMIPLNPEAIKLFGVVDKVFSSLVMLLFNGTAAMIFAAVRNARAVLVSLRTLSSMCRRVTSPKIAGAPASTAAAEATTFTVVAEADSTVAASTVADSTVAASTVADSTVAAGADSTVAASTVADSTVAVPIFEE